MDIESQGYYNNARKLALKEYNKCISKGETGFLPSLEGLLQNIDIISEVNLGTIEIPLSKIVGTDSHLRSICFAKNFMPILKDESEFRTKWTNLCMSHLNEGIQHSIKVYEYMHWYYAIEGNKRVSVLRFFDAYSINAEVIRLIPKMDETDLNVLNYYQFLDFSKATGLMFIYFSKQENYKLLLNMLEGFEVPKGATENKFKYFEKYIFNVFDDIYSKLNQNKLDVSASDAFIEYSKIYGIPQVYDESELEFNLKAFIKDIRAIDKEDVTNLHTVPIDNEPSALIKSLTSLVVPSKKLKVAFVYARNIETSGWTYAHELGRLFVNAELADQIETSVIDNVPEDESAYEQIKALAETGIDVVFTTSPVFLNVTLKCAIEYPNIKFFNCSEYSAYTHVSNYYGRTYEPRFLTGIIAGSMTQADIVGYVATSPTSEVISSINAFALGAKLVNPNVKIKVSWTNEWNSRTKFLDAGAKLISAGADIISNRTLNINHKVISEFGAHSMLCRINRETGLPDMHLATPVWNWGIFYEKILKNVVNDNYKTVIDMFSSNKMLNFWWGMDSKVLDIFYSEELVPQETQKLIKLMKNMIVSNSYSPFTGPIYDDQGYLRVEKDCNATHEEILTMNWYLDNVEIL